MKQEEVPSLFKVSMGQVTVSHLTLTSQRDDMFFAQWEGYLELQGMKASHF
jgi:hypothetical protein